MGLFQKLAKLGKTFRLDKAQTKQPPKNLQRRCRLETMESRELLAADVHLGAVYFESDTGTDDTGDIIEVTFEGGAAGTELTRIVIDGDKFPAGPSGGDIFFDTAPGGLGSFGAVPLQIEPAQGFSVLASNVIDGDSQIEFLLDGFNAGEKLRFSIDADEINNVRQDGSVNTNAIVEGGEFEDSLLTGTFEATGFQSLELTGRFVDAFDPQFATTAQAAGTTLNLNPDAWLPGQDESNRTAGTAAHAPQEFIPAQISGYVYHDRSDDGLRDPGEEGIGGVEIQVIAVNTVDGSSTVHTTTTATSGDVGFWQVTGLAPGEYRVVEVDQPAAYLDGIDTAGTISGVQVGQSVNPDGDQLVDVQLAGGDAGVEYNFGEVLPSSISGHVHFDPERDKVTGPNDVPLEGVQIDLLDDNGTVLDTTFTLADGTYRFDGLRPGTYQVFEHQPDSHVDGGEVVGSAGGHLAANDLIAGIVLTAGTDGVNYDFCEFLDAEISGYVYHDLDDDGVFESGESGIGNVRIEVISVSTIDGSSVSEFTFTNADGFYQFTGLVPGTYRVVEAVQPAGFEDGKDTPGTVAGVTRGQAVTPDADALVDINLAGGDSGVQYNFGEIQLASISGHVHFDPEADKVIGPNDVPLDGVQIDLLDENGAVLDTTFTLADGTYRFDGLRPGTYQVFEHQPGSYVDGGESVGSAGGVLSANDTISQIVLTSGTDAEDYNFCETLHAAISGFVYHDVDNDGLKEDGEEGIAGVEIKLLDANGNDTGLRQLTDSTGFYEFTGLPAGAYTVMEVHPDGWLDGIDTPGTHGGQADNPGDMIAGAVLAAGENARFYNFGERLPGSIRGHVHVDPNGDCILDPGEELLSGVTIELLDASGQVVATTVTNEQGEYAFTDLAPGTYQVREQQPAEYFQGQEQIGSGGGENLGENLISSIAVGSGEDLVDYNFKELPPGAISGFVFQDGEPILTADGTVPSNLGALRDGVRMADDTPLAGVTLQLRDGVTGEPILASAALPGAYPDGPLQTVTDADGFYEFAGLRPGTYAVYQVHPNGFVDHIDTPGTLGGVAANAGEQVDPVLLSQLTVDPANDGILGITLSPGATSLENNFSEVLVLPPPVTPPGSPPPEPPAPNPPAPLIAAVPPVLAPLSPEIAAVRPFLLDSGGGASYTWHLSVVAGGQPRTPQSAEMVAQLTGTRFDTARWEGIDLRAASWTLQERTAQMEADPIFGRPGGIPVTGDFNGDGTSEIGVYIAGEWFIDINGNGIWDDEDLWARLGTQDDRPVTGDWDGDGKDDIGIYGPEWPRDRLAIRHEPGLPDSDNQAPGPWKNIPPQPEVATSGVRSMKLRSQAQLRSDLIDHVFRYGDPADIPVAGDWNGDGIHTIGIFSQGKWQLDVDGHGRINAADFAFEYGQPGDLPVVGDFNGDGIDEVGVYRGGTWMLDTDGDRELTARDRVFEMGTTGDKPVVGDWSGDGVDQPGLYHQHVQRQANAER